MAQPRSEFDQNIFILDRRDGVFTSVPMVSKKRVGENFFRIFVKRVVSILSRNFFRSSD